MRLSSLRAASSRASGEGRRSRSRRWSAIRPQAPRPAPWLAGLLFSRLVERQIELKNIHPRLAEQAEGPTLGALGNELTQAVFWHVTRLGDTGHLEQSGRRRNVRIEAAARSGHQIDRDRRRWILLLERLHIGLDAVNQRLAGRAVV